MYDISEIAAYLRRFDTVQANEMADQLEANTKDVLNRVKRVVFDDFYGGPLSGSNERLSKALIKEFNLNDC